MNYLVDTNIFLHVINSNIFGVADFCKNNGDDVCVTQTIIDELEPGYQREMEESAAREIYTCVSNLVTGKTGFKVIKVIHVSDVAGAPQKLKQIRERFYGWMTDPQYLQGLVDRGVLSHEEIRNPRFRKRDLGECELIAIAEASNGEYLIVTNDRGKVYKHPHMNIFDTYATDIQTLSGKEWLEKIEYVDATNCLPLSS